MRHPLAHKRLPPGQEPVNATITRRLIQDGALPRDWAERTFILWCMKEYVESLDVDTFDDVRSDIDRFGVLHILEPARQW